MKVTITMLALPTTDDNGQETSGAARISMLEDGMKEPYSVDIVAEDRADAVRQWAPIRLKILEVGEAPAFVLHAIKHERWYIA